MKNSNRVAEMARTVQLLEEIGPNINKIARLSGQYKESIRYRYKEKILNKGFSLQARANHEALGLRRLVILADPSPSYRAISKEFFTKMSENCYVVSYSRSVPDGCYVVSASVPSQFFAGDFAGLLSKLSRRKILKPILVSEFDWFRNLPMRAEFYDFRAGKWDFDLSKTARWALEAEKHTPSSEQSFDYVDLLLIKELQVDATRSLTEIGEKLQIGYKRLLRHYGHVIQRRLIHGYMIRWVGTRYDPKTDAAATSKHRYLFLDLLATDLSKYELSELMGNVNRLPFLWAEAGGPNYFAQLAVPLDYTNEVFEYLREKLEPVRDRVRYFIVDPGDARSFTISYQLYDQKRGRWAFNPTKVLDELEHLRIATKPKVTG